MIVIYVLSLSLLVAAGYAAFAMFYGMVATYAAVIVPSLAIAAACYCLVTE